MTREERAHFVTRGCWKTGFPDKILRHGVSFQRAEAAWVRRLAKNITHRRPEENVNASQPFYTSST